jgi:hypothetical protein
MKSRRITDFKVLNVLICRRWFNITTKFVKGRTWLTSSILILPVDLNLMLPSTKCGIGIKTYSLSFRSLLDHTLLAVGLDGLSDCMIVPMMFFCVKAPCGLVGRSHHFGEAYCLHLQGSNDEPVHPELWLLQTSLHGALTPPPKHNQNRHCRENLKFHMYGGSSVCVCVCVCVF